MLTDNDDYYYYCQHHLIKIILIMTSLTYQWVILVYLVLSLLYFTVINMGMLSILISSKFWHMINLITKFIYKILILCHCTFLVIISLTIKKCIAYRINAFLKDNVFFFFFCFQTQDFTAELPNFSLPTDNTIRSVFVRKIIIDIILF